ncbi:MAG: UDP-glucose 4-epimerase GalE [Bacteroidales bacterium]|nr:UDP-glucose 4-epimerase GalE [Bacteroidales bacterium]
MKILVTGGTGYIGSHTAVELLNAGYEVLLGDNLSNSNEEVVQRIKTITGKQVQFEKIDFSDTEASSNFFEHHQGITAIIHFAASKAVGESVEQPLLYYRNNLVSLLNILDAMRKHAIKYIVFSSSATVYGQPDELPVTEKSPFQQANSPYGNTKQISEEIIQDSVKAYEQLHAIALRYFNPIGAHHSALIGELPLGVPNNLVPFITQTAIGLRKELLVFGEDYNTPDGSAIRDYIHVSDLAQAHVKAIDRMIHIENREAFEYFNLGTGTGSSVFEVINTFERVNQLKLNYRVVGRRAGDVEQVWADTHKANEELGWKAQLSLDEALSSAWKWEQFIRSI